MSNPKREDPSTFIEGFRDIFYKIYGIRPIVTIPKSYFKRDILVLSITLSDLYELSNSLAKADPNTCVVRSIKDTKINFRTRAYKYSFIKKAIELGHTPQSISDFLHSGKKKNGTVAINYACKAIDRAYTLDDPKSAAIREIFARVTKYTKEIINGNNR
jgi:hypothetical protein